MTELRAKFLNDLLLNLKPSGLPSLRSAITSAFMRFSICTRSHPTDRVKRRVAVCCLRNARAIHKRTLACARRNAYSVVNRNGGRDQVRSPVQASHCGIQV